MFARESSIPSYHKGKNWDGAGTRGQLRYHKAKRGNYQVDSEVDKGTTFRIVLPSRMELPKKSNRDFEVHMVAETTRTAGAGGRSYTKYSRVDEKNLSRTAPRHS